MQVQEGADTHLTPATHFIDDKNSQYELTNELITSIRTRQHGTRGPDNTAHGKHRSAATHAGSETSSRIGRPARQACRGPLPGQTHILLGLVALLRRVVMGCERGTFGYVTLRARYVRL